MIAELDSLLSFDTAIGLEDLESFSTVLATAKNDFREGHYEEAESRLGAIREGAFSSTMDQITALVESCALSPSDCTVPLRMLSKMGTAQRAISQGDRDLGEMHIYWGLANWSKSVDDPTYASLMGVFLALLLPPLFGRRRPSSRQDGDPDSILRTPQNRARLGYRFFVGDCED